MDKVEEQYPHQLVNTAALGADQHRQQVGALKRRNQQNGENDSG